MKPLISKLHESESGNHPEIRSHGLGYQTMGGRKVSIQSPTAKESIMGEIDPAIDDIRKKSIGHLGNFYWLSKSKKP